MKFLLVGARSSGKTTLGRPAAAALQWSFEDLDDLALGLFEQSTISNVWAVHGEAAWREAEHTALQQVLQSQPGIAALGGGTPCAVGARDNINRARRANQARCIYLHCEGSELARRLQSNPGDRPSLTGESVADEITSIAAEREPIYRNIADAVLDVTQRSHAEALDELLKLIRELHSGDG